MANIRKRANKRKHAWELTVTLGRGADGKYQRVSKTIEVTDEKLLRAPKRLDDYLNAEWQRFKDEVESGRFLAPTKITLSDFVNHSWLENYAKQELSPKTLENYMVQIKLRILPEFGHEWIEKITTMRIVKFLSKLGNEGVSPAMVQYVYRVFRNIFNRAVKWKVIQSNPMDELEKPRAKQKDMEVYDEKETAALFEALKREKPMWQVMILLAVTTGLRRGELLGLTWENVDLEEGVIYVRQSLSYALGKFQIKEPKTKNSVRKVAIPKPILPLFQSYRRQCNKDRLKAADLWEGGLWFFVFTAWNGKPLYPSSVKTWWSRFTTKNKFKRIRFHDLRHTSASLLIAKGESSSVISKRLGHAKINTTVDIYGHLLLSADQAAADKFDDLLGQGISFTAK